MNDHDLDTKVHLTLTGIIDSITDSAPDAVESTVQEEPDIVTHDVIDELIERIIQLSMEERQRLNERLRALYDET